jgi:ribosomal protein S18 acetylase RimI-like enzyme
VRGFYREFILRDGVVAGAVAAPRLARSWRSVRETLRYPSATGDLPAAEVLAVATAADAGNRGLASRVLHALTTDLARRGGDVVKVTVGDGNEAARRMYRNCAFESVTEISVHEGRRSEVMVWTAL